RGAASIRRSCPTSSSGFARPIPASPASRAASRSACRSTAASARRTAERSTRPATGKGRGPRSRSGCPPPARPLDLDVTLHFILSMRGSMVVSTYRVRAFADLAGVTVRALHHYDRLALLRPRRTRSGYRLYTLPDLQRLEQIVALKFLGLPLKQIKTVLDRDARSLPAVLQAQRRALEE